MHASMVVVVTASLLCRGYCWEEGPPGSGWEERRAGHGAGLDPAAPVYHDHRRSFMHHYATEEQDGVVPSDEYPQDMIGSDERRWEEPALLNNTRRLIFFGTKWCGQGSKAKDYEELGLFKDTDACCREHDHCDDIINVNETRHGLTNTGPYTRLHCDCDTRFWDCMKSAGTFYPRVLRYGFFKLLHTVCFKYEYPVIQCDQKTTRLHCDCDTRFWDCMKSAGTFYPRVLRYGFFKLLHTVCFKYEYPVIQCDQKTTSLLLDVKCKKYLLDRTGERLYQWFDSVARITKDDTE